MDADITEDVQLPSMYVNGTTSGRDLFRANHQTDGAATEVGEHLWMSLSEKYPTGVVIGRIISSVVLTVGFPGNFLSALIWLRLTLRDKISSGVYLLSLAVSDSAFLIAYLLQVLYFLWEIRLLSCPYTFCVCYVVSMSSHYLSVLLVLAFNVDRFLAIAFPLKVSSYISTCIKYSTDILLKQRFKRDKLHSLTNKQYELIIFHVFFSSWTYYCLFS